MDLSTPKAKFEEIRAKNREQNATDFIRNPKTINFSAKGQVQKLNKMRFNNQFGV
jgi:hypothetical protein